MLEFLVRSKARRRLLTLLWGEGARGTVSALAEEAGLAFASAHSELKEMHRFGLVRVEREGATDVYAANGEHPEADLLRALLRSGGAAAPPTPTELDETVKRWLKGLGVPLRVPNPRDPLPGLAEVLVEGVRLARKDPTVARALPVGFWLNREDLQVPDLLAYAKRAEEKHALGFFLELTGTLGGDRRLVGLAESFRDKRMSAERDFFLLPPTASRRRLSEMRTPEVARRWGFTINLDCEAFRSLFEKFVHEEQDGGAALRAR
jgi:hypothetical protein